MLRVTSSNFLTDVETPMIAKDINCQSYGERTKEQPRKILVLRSTKSKGELERASRIAESHEVTGKIV
ncbi:hypothetical protein J6590_103870 [Homalodisca vitripennis]|nr:hypothetical protein J6590_103870 [Homalodisca vitripennis]